MDDTTRAAFPPLDDADARRRPGRPLKGDAPLINYAELDRLIVFGEHVPCPDGKGTMTSHPSYRELATRYGVSIGVIGDYAKKHNCQNRRRLAETRILARADEKQVEIHAEAIAVSREEQVAIIDTYPQGFKQALAENRVRFDNPTDYNTMSRLKEFLQGGADSRQELHGELSLEALQRRHVETRRMMRESTAQERGEVVARPSRGDLVADGEDAGVLPMTEEAPTESA